MVWVMILIMSACIKNLMKLLFRLALLPLIHKLTFYTPFPSLHCVKAFWNTWVNNSECWFILTFDYQLTIVFNIHIISNELLVQWWWHLETFSHLTVSPFAAHYQEIVGTYITLLQPNDEKRYIISNAYRKEKRQIRATLFQLPTSKICFMKWISWTTQRYFGYVTKNHYQSCWN